MTPSSISGRSIQAATGPASESIAPSAIRLTTVAGSEPFHAAGDAEPGGDGVRNASVRCASRTPARVFSPLPRSMPTTPEKRVSAATASTASNAVERSTGGRYPGPTAGSVRDRRGGGGVELGRVLGEDVSLEDRGVERRGPLLHEVVVRRVQRGELGGGERRGAAEQAAEARTGVAAVAASRSATSTCGVRMPPSALPYASRARHRRVRRREPSSGARRRWRARHAPTRRGGGTPPGAPSGADRR